MLKIYISVWTPILVLTTSTRILVLILSLHQVGTYKYYLKQNPGFVVTADEYDLIAAEHA